jgi:hypothetical protein
MRHVRAAVGSATIKPDLLTAAERIQYEGYLRRKDANSAILKQAETGVSIYLWKLERSLPPSIR